MKIHGNGGTLNADFQCSAVHSNGRLGNDVVLVMNSCKDFRPSQYWVCICLPGLRYFYVDVRHFGIPSTVKTPKDLREHMADMIGRGGFADVEALWAYAKANDLPRLIHENSCRRLGIALDEDDLNHVVGVDHKQSSCRAFA